MLCIDDQMISAYLDGELKEPYRQQVEEHLSYCRSCSSRLDEMRNTDNMISAASLDEKECTRNKEKIYSLLEKKYFSEENKKSFFRKKVEFSLPSLVTAAAAVVFIFVGSFVFFGSNAAQTEEILPSFSVNASSGNVEFVSQRQSSLDDYTLEEILSYLDSKGYDISLRLKGLEDL